ncbi:MAG TPA: ABC transporter substrate-binding protein [Anaerolineae bacterium]
MPDLSGHTLGKYQIIERLGRGGMADVYKGYQPGLDRYVAVKVLHEHLAEDPDFITRFRREAKSVAELRHPYIVQVFDFDVQGSNYYMVMEYVEGGKTLKQLLQELSTRGERLPLEVTLDIVSKLADALAYAHGIGMMHRDIKPANVLLPTLNRPVLSDFGIARIVGQTGLTSSGMMVGTPAYMSPEQGMGERGDERSDIYALGVVLYEMLTGHPPYDADTPYAVILKHINDPLIPPHTLVGALPDAVERIVLKSLAKNPDDRFSSMAAMRNALRAAHAEVLQPVAETAGPPGAAIGARPPEAVKAAAPQATRIVAERETAAAPARPAPEAPARRLRFPAWAIVAVVVVAAILAGVGLLAGRAPGATTPSVGTPASRATQVSPAQGLIDTAHEKLLRGDFDAALDLYERALATDPENPDALAGRAVAHLSRWDDPQESADVLGPLASARPNDPLVHYGLGLLHSRYDNYANIEKAVAEFTLAIDHCGDRAALCAAAYHERAQLHAWTLGNLDAALSDMDNAIRLYPFQETIAWLHASRADMRAASGDGTGALEDFEAAFDQSQDGTYLERAAATAVHYQDYERGLGYYRRLIDDQPDNPHHVVMRGYVQWRAGDFDGALQTAQHALDLPAKPLEARYLIGLLLLEAGQPQDALAQLRMFGAVTDSDILYQASFPFLLKDFGHEINYDMARAAHAAGDLDAALGYINRSIQNDDYWAEAYIERGAIYADRGDIDRAREDFRKALEIAADRPELQAVIQERLASIARGRIKIATQSPLSGSQARAGIDIRRAAELALDQLGGTLRDMGFSVEIVPYDDQGNQDTAIKTAAQAASDPDILCVVGHFQSSATTATTDQYHRAGLAVISPSATSFTVTEKGYLEINRVVGRDDVQGVVGAGYAKSLGVRSVYIVHDNAIAGQAIAGVFRQAAQELGIQVAGFVGTDERSDFSAGRLLLSIVSANPDLVYFGGYYDQAGVFFKQLRERGYAGVLMGPEGMDSPGLVELGGEALITGGGMLYSTVAGSANFYPGATQFLESFRAQYDAEPMPFAAQAYDAAGICLSAIERAIQDNGGELPSRQQVAQAVRATQDYPGITGNLSFNEHGDLKTAKYFMIRVVSTDPSKWHANKIEYSLDFTLPEQ